MRKPRDYDSELKALEDRARQLKDRRIRQLGELVIATGADGLTSEQLAGALLAAMNTTDDATKEAWTRAGAAFFQRGAATGRKATRDNGKGTATDADRTQPDAAEAGAQ
ncbi:conjugal transfer protein TraD [Sphingomonas sp. Leaf37]|uniref:conjugal transfer protein TraD n=1 Tax=Sphingomonas sp. Leaf37 TaxID=2876552 RepID=UPI001E57E117|nr:conjugal transfer protein TraD [Sphingomonas sp. Leaf37]